MPQGLGKEEHFLSLIPGKLHFSQSPRRSQNLGDSPKEIKTLTSLPLSGQWLRFRADGSHGQSCLPRRGQREIQIQRASFSVQWLQSNGSLHLALYGAGTCPAVDGQWGHFRAHSTLQ